MRLIRLLVESSMLGTGIMATFVGQGELQCEGCEPVVEDNLFHVGGQAWIGSTHTTMIRLIIYSEQSGGRKKNSYSWSHKLAILRLIFCENT